jgi:phage-related minor tail protein
VRAIRILATALLLTVLSLRSAPAQEPSGSGDPVADAARKAREQKKNAPKPRKVFTDDDVAPNAAEPQPPAAPAEPKSDAVPAAVKPELALAENAAQKENPHSEKAWRKRFADQRRRIAAAEQELEVLQRESQKADVQYYSDPQKALKEQYSRREINEKTTKAEAKKKEIATLKQQLNELEEELRRTGGDPGWAR